MGACLRPLTQRLKIIAVTVGGDDGLLHELKGDGAAEVGRGDRLGQVAGV